MAYITPRGKLHVKPKTELSLNKMVSEIDRRVAGAAGANKHGKVIRNPQAYVWGGVRKSVAKK
jgi:hypothetical protein